MIDRFQTWLSGLLGAPKLVASPAQPTVVTTQIEHDNVQNVVPYDETLLEQCRTQWQLGDWESLAKLDRDTLQHHPDRAKLALLAAAGHLQQGNSQAAHQFTRLAQDWGCSKKLISQILISGVHNSLGRAHLANRNHAKALSHIEEAIQTGTPGACFNLFTQVQVRKNLDKISECLGNSDQNRIHLSQNSEIVNEEPRSPTAHQIVLSNIGVEKYNIPKQNLVDAQFDLTENNLTENILVIFSTPRCGSTYLCNLLQANNLCIPDEYFQLEQYLPILAQRWGCTINKFLEGRKYIQSLCNKRTTKNGWLGINLHSHHINTFEELRKFFPFGINYHFIHVLRRDTLGQAISYEIAEQTGCWNSFYESSSEPNYSFTSLNGKVKSINDGNFYIRAYIERNKLSCKDVFYEELLINPAIVVSGIFPTSQVVNTRSAIKKQANEVNQEWRRRYQADLFPPKY